MTSPLDSLGVALPVLAAPMAGGPTTPELVEAAGRVGALGFLAAGYRTAEALADQVARVRPTTPAFGVNLFVPDAAQVSVDDYRDYADVLRPLAAEYDVELPPFPVRDDDALAAKLDLLCTDPVPLVSFTFALPDRRAVAALRRQGTLVAQSVTTAREAQAADEIGVDLLVVQGAAAGGHSATFTPAVSPVERPLPDLVDSVRAVSRTPVIAAGGLAGADDVAAVLGRGAVAVAVGTALLRAPESGTSHLHRTVITDPAARDTVLTRAFTGRPARAVPNWFVDRFDALAPAGYPEIHHLTRPLRAAAAQAGDARLVHVWAGTGYRHADDRPAGEVLRGLAARL